MEMHEETLIGSASGIARRGKGLTSGSLARINKEVANGGSGRGNGGGGGGGSVDDGLGDDGSFFTDVTLGSSGLDDTVDTAKGEKKEEAKGEKTIVNAEMPNFPNSSGSQLNKKAAKIVEGAARRSNHVKTHVAAHGKEEAKGEQTVAANGNEVLTLIKHGRASGVAGRGKGDSFSRVNKRVVSGGSGLGKGLMYGGSGRGNGGGGRNGGGGGGSVGGDDGVGDDGSFFTLNQRDMNLKRIPLAYARQHLQFIRQGGKYNSLILWHNADVKDRAVIQIYRSKDDAEAGFTCKNWNWFHNNWLSAHSLLRFTWKSSLDGFLVSKEDTPPASPKRRRKLIIADLDEEESEDVGCSSAAIVA